MKRLLALALFLVSGVSYGQIAIDAASAASGGASAAAAPTWNITIGSGRGRYVLVGCSLASNLTSVTAGGVSMALLVRAAVPNISELWGLYSPASGVTAIQITGAATPYECGAISYSGVGGTYQTQTNTGSGVTSLSTTFASKAGNMIVDNIDCGSSAANTPVATGSGHVRREFNNGGGNRCQALGDVGGSASLTPGWTFSSTNASLAAVELVPRTRAHSAEMLLPDYMAIMLAVAR